MLICVIIFAFGLVSVSAEKYGDLYSTTSNGEVTITGCDFAAKTVMIPSTINGYPVTSIGSFAFSQCSGLTSVIIPNSVKSIGSYAFENCSSLTSITIPDSVTSIDDYAFSYCSSLTSIIIPDSVTSINKSLFKNCSNLTSVIIPNDVTSIGESAFENCNSLTSITIPDNVTSIGDFAFAGCNSLTNITIPDNVTSIADYAFSLCKSLTSVIIPNSVTSIGSYAFQSCSSLTSIIIPNSVTDIGRDAFRHCIGLTSITIPNSVKSIGDNVFDYCSALTNIYVDVNNENYCSEDGVLYNKIKTKIIRFPQGKSNTFFLIPDSVTSIGNCAFYRCSNLTSITIPNSVTNIDDYAFSDCSSLTGIIIPDGVTSINKSVFRNCSNLTNVTIPGSVTSIGNGAFSGCSGLTSVTIPDSVTSIGNGAFSDCSSLTSIIIPNSVTSISSSLFSMCTNLTSVTLSNSATSIGMTAFYGCPIASITIPNSIISIGDSAFGYCGLTSTYYNGTEEQWKKINIGTDNICLTSNLIYFAYINLLDKDGNKISSKTQNMGKTVDTSVIIVPKGSILKLYKDRELTQEYSIDTPISENLTLYADIIEINKLKISGVQKADIGQKNILQSVTFATDKTAKNLIATVKYPETLLLNEIRSVDFDITQSKYTTSGYTYLNLECAYKNGNMPENKTLNPFDLIFDVSENAKPDDVITIEFDSNTFLADESGNTYDFDSVGSAQITVNPILVQSIVINGESEIDNAVQYTATVLPEKATNKEIEWSVDNAEIASISKDGVLTPIKSGNVKIIATAKDGSNVFGEKTVSVKVYAEISSLKSNIGVWDKSFKPTEREYVIYVPKDTAAVNLTAKHSGKLKAGTEPVYNGREKPIVLSDDETIITLTYSCTGYTDSVYTVKFIKFEGTKTTVTESGKSFTIKPVNIATGNTVILALYNGEEFVETQNVVYTGNDILFTTDKKYKNAKVMVWDNLSNMEPVCDIETVK